MGHRTGGAMSKIKFEKAMLLIEGEFFNQLSWWPEWFPPVNLAVLQSPLKDSDTRAWLAAIESAVKTGELASTLKPYLWRPPILIIGSSTEFDEQLIPFDELTVTASDFAAWLTAQGEEPSELIAAWFTAVGAQAKDGDNAPAQTAAMPAPVVAVDASNAPKTQSNFMKKVALIAELEYEWQSITKDISDAARNGLKAAAHAGKHGEWDRDKARAWAVSKGKIKRAAHVSTPAAPWPGAVTRHTIKH